MPMTISVVIAAFCGEEFIGEQIRSLLGQSLPPDEIIITDGSPDERMMEVVAEFLPDPRIRCFRNEKQLGVNGNFEKALSLATGEIIFFCDQDDVWKSDKIAKMVAALGDIHKAAIASSYCAEIYGLKVLAPNIQTAEHNTTRFVAVSRENFHSEHANKISLVFSLPHQPGSLNRLLSRFSDLQLNLTKIESRPVADKNFEYYFYLDFAGNTETPAIGQLIGQLEKELPAFTFLGNYEEI